MGIASLVLGIISIIIGLFSVGVLGWLGGIIGIVGIVLGISARKDPMKRGVGTAGFVCSIVGTVLCLIMYVACIACIGGIASLS